MSFITNILPWNYWITKSMEFVKIQSSWTLWYLKKWIVFYYYVFLKEELFDKDYEEIKSIFDNFISSLPTNIKDSANDFFYEIDIKSNDFIKMNSFINYSVNSFSSQEDKKQYIIKAKRFYFMYLMNSWWQSWWKKKIKDKIFSWKSYQSIINEITSEMISEWLSQWKIDEQLSDFPASIRNERQIFFYYGFFHWKDSSDLSWFYNLTNIWKTILYSNFHELLLIWEHQKLKMVSQSPVIDIQNLHWTNKDNLNINNFDILNHPYYQLLLILKENNEISLDQYQYVISKLTNSNDIEIWKILDEKLINESKEFAIALNRRWELEPEDFLKELKKFILWICELPKDSWENYLSFISWVKQNKIIILNNSKANFIIESYWKITNYFDSKYWSLYLSFSNELKDKYINIISWDTFEWNDDTIYEWYKYIINFDKDIYLNLIYIAISNRESKYDYSISQDVLFSYFDDYKNILKMFWINKSDYKNIIIEIQQWLSIDKIYSIESLDDSYDMLNDSRLIEKTISEEKLKELSITDTYENWIHMSIIRKRNISLISALRSYYNKNYSDTTSKLIKCDCCWETTFITDSNYAYLEFHHLIPFSTDFGPDHYLNLFWICPSCHRKMHYLNYQEKPALYIKLSENNNFRKTLVERINFLYENNILEPIHLDFLKKEKIINKEQYNKLLNNLTISI